MTIVNPQLVEQITTLVREWSRADRLCQEIFHGWEQRAARAGIERGFYLAVGALPGTYALCGEDGDDLEAAGRHIYAAYRQGSMVAALEG